MPRIIYKDEKTRKKAQARRSNQYNKEHLYSMAIRLNKVNDAELIEYIKSQPNKTSFFARLVREDMLKNKSPE